MCFQVNLTELGYSGVDVDRFVFCLYFIYQTSETVLYRISNTKRNMTHIRVFLMKFKVMKHCMKCLM